MENSADQTSGAATAIVDTNEFRKFREQKLAKTLPTNAPAPNPGADSAIAADKDKPAPNSGADVSTKSRKQVTQVDDDKEITDDDISEEQSARTRRKMSKLLNARSNERAARLLAESKAAALQAKLDEKEKPVTAKAPVIEGKRPRLEDYLEGKHGDFKTFKEAHAAYEDAIDEYEDQKLEARLSKSKTTDTRESEKKTLMEAFEKSLDAFEKANPKANFQESYTLVLGELDGRTNITDAIVRSEDPAELIDQLAHNEDVLERIAGMSDNRALIELGRFVASIEAKSGSGKPEGETPTNKKPLDSPKAPRQVGARGDVPNTSLQAMKNASEMGPNGDYRAFKAAKYAGMKK